LRQHGDLSRAGDEQGATQDNDVTFLFIANKPLDIHYTRAS
jgi:hypothetical protein